MSHVLVSAPALAAVYLLVLSSLAPGDLLIGGLLGLAVAMALRPWIAHPRRPLVQLVPAIAGLVKRTAAETVVGSWRAALFCLGKRASPGLVEIPRESRSTAEVAVWALSTTEAPDEFAVDVDEARGMLVVHVVDASDPVAVRARHARAHERWRQAGWR